MLKSLARISRHARLRRISVSRGLRSRGALWICVAICLLANAPSALAQLATLDLLLDLDENPATGCVVATADGDAAGIEARLRTWIDVAADSVLSSGYALCGDGPSGAFGEETAIPATGTLPPAPWNAVTGNGASGSTLVETHLPLSFVSGTTAATVSVALGTASGEDAMLATSLGAPIRIALAPPVVPGLGLPGAMLGTLFMLLLGSWAWPRDAGGRAHARRRPLDSATRALGAGLVFLLVLPVTVRAALGEGTLRVWSPLEQVAEDARGDAPVDADLLNLHALLDPIAGELYLRADAFFGPAVCLDWSLVDPGTGFVCAQEPPPDQGPFGFAVALTFDDGPNPATTPQILSILRTENIPATFFMRGDRLVNAAARALALEIHQDPLFRVANHTVDHDPLTDLTPEEIQWQLDTTSERIREAIDDPCYFPKYFRFPYGMSDCDSMQVVRENGHGVAGVNVDPVDWCYASGGGYCEPQRAPWVPDVYRDDMPGYAVHRLMIAGGGIMLMHDIHPNTVSELPSVIAALRTAGASFVDLADPLYFPILNANVQIPEPPACCDGVVR